jgi:poly [ADP-ribose] polymerase
MANILREVRLIKTEVKTNNNKFWNGVLYDDGTVKAEWGRVGYSGDNGEWDGGEKYLDKKLKEKMKKGYSEQKTIGVANTAGSNSASVKNGELSSIAKSQLVKTSNPTLDKLIDRLVKANVHRITANTQITYNSTTGLFATPLGIVTMEGLTEARDILADIAPFVRGSKYGDKLDALVSKYLRIIPQNVGMKLRVERLLPDDNSIQKQNDLIDSLESSYQAMQATPAVKSDVTKKLESVFNVDMDVLNDDRTRDRLTKWFEKSKKSMHHYDKVKVREVFVIKIDEMDRAYDRNIPNPQEVWHGTSQANCLSILKSGLKTSPPSTAAIAGKMFGNGIYGAINSSKSMGYTFGRWGQGGTGDSGWLFVCDFAMGKTYSTRSSCHKPSGYDSVWAKAGGNLYNDELIVYKNNQCNIRYLLEVK